MASSGIAALDKTLAADGYPDRSTVLVVGPAGIGKEALGYWFALSALAQGDFCLYVTRLSVKEVLQDEKGFGIDTNKRVPLWFASDGGQVKYDVDDLAGLSYNIKDVLKQNSGRRVRIVIDVLPSLLMLNPPDTIYRFLTQLFADVGLATFWRSGLSVRRARRAGRRFLTITWRPSPFTSLSTGAFWKAERPEGVHSPWTRSLPSEAGAAPHNFKAARACEESDEEAEGEVSQQRRPRGRQKDPQGIRGGRGAPLRREGHRGRVPA